MCKEKKETTDKKFDLKAKIFDHLKKWQKYRPQIKWKKIDFSVATWRKKISDAILKIKNYPYAQTEQKIKNNLINGAKKLKHFSEKISDYWKTILFCCLTFIGVYYGLGSLLSEKIDVKSEYKPVAHDHIQFETANALSYLIKREVDDKMWTPNLPIIFPAYALDNMPNFQMGLTAAVRDTVSVLRKSEWLNEAQQNDIDEAFQLLKYPPQIWLLSKQGTFGIAPSSNAQYRRAAKRLQKFNLRQDFSTNAADFDKILNVIMVKLRKLIASSEAFQRENAGHWIDFKSDDLFYYHQGYAFALWQIGKTLGIDYKAVILKNNAYTDWTFLVSSLRKAAEFKPLWIRNGKPESLWTPNHLLTQNYYFTRALSAAEQVYYLNKRGIDADQN